LPCFGEKVTRELELVKPFHDNDETANADVGTSLKIDIVSRRGLVTFDNCKGFFNEMAGLHFLK
jgi:hypothetical protein